ncbi:MAG: phosphatidylserine decarboxylase, partial [Synergistota bacterium]|nr:phosphatidylserine decarboxylase [Synergistota bacterium]
MKPVREGWAAIALVAFMMLGSLYFAPPVALFLAPLLPGAFWFFRDPDRQAEKEGYLSPADGVVAGVERGEFPSIGKALRISIETGLFDVHVNRSPCDGVVERLVRYPGRMKAGAATNTQRKWERTIIELSTDFGLVILAQTAGFPGRDVVCRLSKDKRVSRGERYGLMASASRVDLYVPAGTRAQVEEGDRVLAGTSVLAV